MNPYRGEVQLTVDGESYALVFDWDAVAQLRATYGAQFDARLFEACYSGDVSTMSRMLEIALRKRHPDITVEQIMAASPVINDVALALTSCITLAFTGKAEPEPLEQAQGDLPRPPVRKATLLQKLGQLLSGSVYSRASSGG